MSVNTLVYKSPDPAKVAYIAATCGFENACERWGWISPLTIQKLVALGSSPRTRRPVNRRTTLAEDERLVAQAQRLSSYAVVADRAGVSQDFMRRLFYERGLPLPTLSPDRRRAHNRSMRRGLARLLPAYSEYIRGVD